MKLLRTRLIRAKKQFAFLRLIEAFRKEANFGLHDLIFWTSIVILFIIMLIIIIGIIEDIDKTDIEKSCSDGLQLTSYIELLAIILFIILFIIPGYVSKMLWCMILPLLIFINVKVINPVLEKKGKVEDIVLLHQNYMKQKDTAYQFVHVRRKKKKKKKKRKQIHI